MKATIGTSLLDTVKKLGARVDGWFNVLTGLGTTTLDKRMNTQIDWRPPTEVDVDEMYASDDIAAKVVDLLPEDAMREGVKWIKLDDEQQRLMKMEQERLNFLEKLQEGWKWGRLQGGAVVVMITDDGAPMDEPLNLKTLRRLVAMVPLTRWEVFPFEWDYDIESKNYGFPNMYQIQPRVPTTAQAMFRCHHTRIIRFDGPPLPIRLSLMNWRWGDSVLSRLRGPLINYVSSNDAAASALIDFRFNIFKMKNLSALIAAGKQALVQQRLQLIQMTRNVARAVVVEEGEEYTTDTTDFAGIKDVLDQMKSRLQSAAQMPRTKLFGESPAGLGATGRHEEVNWYDFVKSKQTQVLTPRLNRVLDVIYAQRMGPFGGQKPAGASFEYAPLWQLDEKEQADVRAVMATADEKYITLGVLDPQTVALSRFGGQKFSIDTKLTTLPPDHYKPPQEQQVEPSDLAVVDRKDSGERRRRKNTRQG